MEKATGSWSKSAAGDCFLRQILDRLEAMCGEHGEQNMRKFLAPLEIPLSL